jgi:DNA primase
MSDTSTVIDKIKALPVSEVIGQYLQLKKYGAMYKASCPFHNEKTASFSVSNSKNIFKCFGCGAAGDAITFVQEYTKTDFIGALKDITNRFNIDYMPNGDPHTADVNRRNKESIYILNNIAAAWFAAQLKATPAAMAYLTDTRELTTDTIESRALGYAPDSWTGLYTYLKSQQYTDDQLRYSGLITYKDDGKIFDYFRNRIIIPITGINGKIIGFGGRDISGIIENTSSAGVVPPIKGGGQRPGGIKAPDYTPAKYLNSPETAIFNKGLELYNFYQGKKEIETADLVYITEGYFDVISAAQAGTANIIAGMGTSFTTEQIEYINRYTKNVCLVYDADRAGQDAAQKNGEAMLAAGLNVKIIALECKDIDEFIKTLK